MRTERGHLAPPTPLVSPYLTAHGVACPTLAEGGGGGANPGRLSVPEASPNSWGTW